MKAMIFAAGMGNRLKPLTDTTPKALIPVNGIPMLEHIITKLKTAGFQEIIINVHHLAGQIIDFIQTNNSFGITIHISDERDYLLDTGGGIKQAAQFLEGNEPFLVHNTDILSNVDLKAIYQEHITNNSLATLLVNKRETSRYLLFNNEHELCGWRNRDTGEVKSHYPDFEPEKYKEFAFGGIHVMSPRIFEWMEEWTGKFSIINFYLAICAKANIKAFEAENLQLMDIGKPETLAKANEWIKKWG
ncbi:MAG: nucleotidyltransferase family protein [Tannerellaceae bacterium]|nr:nucleotidyltransferase family protein [Tannerellaceae bacterium]